MVRRKKWSTTGISFGTNNAFRTVYVYDMTEGVSSYIILFVDARILSKIRNHKDFEELQNNINKIYEWSMVNGTCCKKIPCIGNGKKCNETLMDV